MQYVLDLRAQEGGEISVVGGVETIRSLFAAGVIDALTLTVHPVATPEGRRLFDESVPLTRFRLLEGRTTSAGNAVLTYGLR
ncbi:dihydrofolate reductase family protein [Isoptericola sp. b490]|uniref:dihydrofolate reductase family protein n=1 Tax=Actinotalea lenta TaxID=3064654 RepID=UPI0027128A0E|nr:dihydrofolate reductase family protein [Isoptericola sp. b490]MDO8121261.1 dihydrofolate reductase family protein [Isoptericola sp. b490]